MGIISVQRQPGDACDRQPAGWEIGFAFFAVDKFSSVTLFK